MLKTMTTENNTKEVSFEEEFKDTRRFMQISRSHMNMNQQFRKWKQDCHSSEEEDEVPPMANVSFKYAMCKYDTKKLEKGKNKRKTQGMKFKSEDDYVLK
jgi:hypothetical protein